MDEKTTSLAILGLVVVISVSGLVMLFNESATGNIALKSGGQRFVSSRGMAYSQSVMLCEQMIGLGKIPKTYTYEATYNEMVNRFGSDHCVDASNEVGYWCCQETVLGRY